MPVVQPRRLAACEHGSTSRKAWGHVELEGVISPHGTTELVPLLAERIPKFREIADIQIMTDEWSVERIVHFLTAIGMP